MRSVRPLPALLALTLALTLAGCGGESSETLLQEARQSLKAGDTKAAVIHLKSAVQADPENAEARFELGRLQLESGEFASAEKELRRARQLGLPADRINPLLARALNGLREFQRVREEIPRPDAGSPNEAALLVAIAQAELATRDPDAARASLARASEVAPQDPDVQLGLARLALADSDVPRALQILDDSLKAAPRHRDTRLLKADLLFATGKAAEASQAYRSALEIDPELHTARLALADIALSQNRPGDARREAEAVLKASPNLPQADYVLALIDHREKKYESARDRLTRVLRVAPDFVPALLLAGVTEFTLGNLQTAETHLNDALKAQPRNPLALRVLAATKLRQGQAADAARLLNGFPAEAQDAAFHIVAGETALAQREFAKAAQHFDLAAQKQPDNAAIRTQLGVSRLAQGDARALADLQAASALDSQSDRADTIIVLDHLRKQRFDEALASIARLEKKTQASPLTWSYRGAAWLGKKDIAKARDSFERALKLDPGFFPAAASLAQLDLRAQQPDRARQRFEGVLKADPKNSTAMLALAELSQRANDSKTQLAWLEKARAADPAALLPRLAMARHLLSVRDTDKALSLARETLTAHPNHAAAIELLAAAQLASGDTANAIGSYRRLVERQPGQVPPLVKLAAAQILAKDTAGARRSLESALRIQPDAIPAKELLVGVEVQDNRHDRALALAREIQTQQPRLAQGHVLQAQVHLARKQHSEALAAYERAFRLQPSGVLLVPQMLVHRAMGTAEAGEQKILAWLANNPGDASARAALAESLLTRQQYRQAVEHYLTLDRQVPGNAVVLNNLAWALAQLSDKRALTYAEQAHKLAPDDPAILDTYGWVQVQLGNPARGLELLKRANARAPDSADIHWHLAYAYHATGDTARARQELKTLLDRRVRFGAEPEARALYQQLTSR